MTQIFGQTPKYEGPIYAGLGKSKLQLAAPSPKFRYLKIGGPPEQFSVNIFVWGGRTKYYIFWVSGAGFRNGLNLLVPTARNMYYYFLFWGGPPQQFPVYF